MEEQEDELLLALLGRGCTAEWRGLSMYPRWLISLPDGAQLPLTDAAIQLRIYGGNIRSLQG